jgi:hypothetical protein
MKYFVRGAATLALLACCTGQAKAALAIPGQGPPPGSPPVLSGADPAFYFTFSIGGVTGSGTLFATSNGDGTYTAISGTATETGANSQGTMALSLIANPTPTGEVVSQSGFFLYDDQLLPGQNPLITNGGLLFRSANGNEVNIYSNGASSYQYYENNGYNTVGSNFTLTAVPEPATFVMGGTALLAGLGYTLIRRRKVAIA